MLRRIFSIILILLWIFSGWPKIFNFDDFSFPPKMEKARASIMPVFQAAGTVQGGTGALTVPWPSHQANDIGLLVIETDNNAVTLGANAANWTTVTNSPQGTGTPGQAGALATRLTVFWSRATSGSMGSVGVNDSGDHQRARIFTFRGCITSGNPWDITAGDVASSGSTNVSIPGATTTVPNTLVVAIIANGIDANPDQSNNNWTNANLANIVQRESDNINSGNGGGFSVATGEKAVTGTYGATTMTLKATSVQGRMSIALMPPANIQPALGSISDSPDPVAVGSDITFSSGTWTDSDNVNQRMFVCKTNALTSTSTGGCAGGTWLDTGSYTSSNPQTGIYTALSGNAGTNNYYVFICDEDKVSNSCSTSSSGTFFVNAQPALGTVSDNPDPVDVDSDVTFSTGTWTDGNSGETIKMFVCKTDALTSQSTGGCSGGSWYDGTSDSYVSTNPLTKTYTAQSGDVGMNNYYVFICDAKQAGNSCSASGSGTFTVNSAGSLSVDIVDSGGTPVGSPSVTFGAKVFNWIAQTSTGTLGVAAQKIRVNNTTGTPSWTLSVAATSGPTALWSDGSNTYDFNGSAVAGRLEVDASGSTITPQGGCSTTGLSKGTATYFAQGTQDSINLVTAGGSAQTNCYWDITGVNLNQDIPASQAIGSYSIVMTLTAA